MAINQTTTVLGTLPSNPAKGIARAKVNKIAGLEFPTGSGKNKGFFNRVVGKKMIVGNLRQLFRTERGERIMLPSFGMALQRFLFEPLDSITFSEIKDEILGQLAAFEPRVQVLRLRIVPLNDYGTEGLQAISITLTLQIKDSYETPFDVQVKIK